MKNTLLPLLAVLTVSAAAQAAEPERALSSVILRLTTTDRAAFDAVSNAALPFCKALSMSAQREGGGKPFERYGIDSQCPAVNSPAQAEALRLAVLKAFGKAEGQLELSLFWEPKQEAKQERKAQLIRAGRGVALCFMTGGARPPVWVCAQT